MAIQLPDKKTIYLEIVILPDKIILHLEQNSPVHPSGMMYRLISIPHE
jgi:hypothetical protein